MRFWEGHFPIMVDIKDMFYEVKVLIKDIGFIGSCCTQTPGYLITNISCRLFNFGKTNSCCCAKWALKSRTLKYSPEVLGTFTWMTVWINSPSLEQPISVIANVMQLLKSSWFILSLFETVKKFLNTLQKNYKMHISKLKFKPNTNLTNARNIVVPRLRCFINQSSK